MEFLGHKVEDGQMTIPETRAEALLNYNRPQTKKGLRSLLGAVSFYRHYIKQLASDTATLSPATSKVAPSKLNWTKDMELAFTNISRSVSQSCLLTIPLPEDVM